MYVPGYFGLSAVAVTSPPSSSNQTTSFLLPRYLSILHTFLVPRIGVNWRREKELPAGELNSIGKSSAAEKMSPVRGNKGSMFGLVGALIFGIFIL
jgi:hypothetical protein